MAAVICFILLLFMNTAFSFTLQRSLILLRRSSFERTRFPLQKSATTTTYNNYRLSLSAKSSTTSNTSTMTSTSNNRIIMVLSPAKTMDLRPLSEREFSHDDVNEATLSQISNKYDTGICDIGKTTLVCNEMKGKSKSQLKSLLSLSDNLATVANNFWTEFTLDAKNVRDFLPSIYTFSGPAFQGLAPSTCDTKALSYLASHLFILDPVYGVLRSLQGMQPYRLEMACRLFGNKSEKKPANLAGYWKEEVTTYLGKELGKDNSETTTTPSSSESDEGEGRILINLASEEYSSSIDVPSLPPNTLYLNVVFRHKGRSLAVHAKKARGMMARYLADREATTVQDVSEFDCENYACVDVDGESWQHEDTVGDNVKIVRMIFDREDAPPKADGKKKGKTGSAKRSAAGTKKQGGASKKTKK